MSENLIIFDEQYVAEQIKRISQAQKLVEEALNIIRKANQHKTWQCEERYKIDESMNILSNRLNRVNMGIIRTANALGRGFKSFLELESRSTAQVQALSDNLRERYGFTASNYKQDENINLPVTQIPKYDNQPQINSKYDDLPIFNNTGSETQTEEITGIFGTILRRVNLVR